LGEFVLSRVRELEQKGDTVLGTITEGVFQESMPGEYWDTIRTGDRFENPEFITVEKLTREHAFIVEQFENRMDKVLGYSW
nr:hypothetical protein [Proteiniphilum sp.]